MMCWTMSRKGIERENDGQHIRRSAKFSKRCVSHRHRTPKRQKAEKAFLILFICQTATKCFIFKRKEPGKAFCVRLHCLTALGFGSWPTRATPAINIELLCSFRSPG